MEVKVVKKSEEQHVLKCPLGHIQKDTSGWSIIGEDVVIRVCDTCGIVFDPRVTKKFWQGKTQSQ